MILVDYDVLIAHLRGVEAARDWLIGATSTNEVAISVLTIAEITGGMRGSERSQVWRLLTAFKNEPVTLPIAERAGELRRAWQCSHSGIGLVDYLIAATAEKGGYDLATLNVRHYPMIPNLVAPFVL